MKIKWKSIYYPYGEWIDESGSKVDVSGNFKCKYNDIDLACIMINGHSPAGHGECAIDSQVPFFINADTFDPVKVDGFVEVSDK